MANRTDASSAAHLNPNLHGMGSSPTVAINERSDALRREGREILKLGLGQSPFPVPQGVVAALQEHAHEKDYLPVRGLAALRATVADFHRRRDGLQATADDVLIGPGSKELMFILQLAYAGELVIPAPSWVSYAPQAQIVGRPVRWLPTRPENNWMLEPAQLAALGAEDPGRPRLLILNYPSNPTGDTFTADQLEAIAAVAREHDLLLLSDEIYGEVSFRGEHVSMARFYPEGTIVSSGLSKWCGAGGWRLGTFLFPPRLRWLLDAMAAVASETFTSTSAPIQYAAVRAFEGGAEIERYLVDSRRALAALGEWCADTLAAAGVSVRRPKGGFYLFPDFSPAQGMLRGRGIADSAALCARLLDETGVAILPGSVFGRPPAELTARLAYVDFDGAEVLGALADEAESFRIDEGWLRVHCPKVIEAIERLVAWIGGVHDVA